MKRHRKILPIRPGRVDRFFSEPRMIPVSKIVSGRIPEKSVRFSKAIVAYVDVLGFARKKNSGDMQATIHDFHGALAISSLRYPRVRFNTFSDCAFLSTPRRYASHLLGAVRLAFTSWISNAILVRGGLAMGDYKEDYTAALDMAPNNFEGKIFFGRASTNAVRLESKGIGALLFADDECAQFYKKRYGEPIYRLNGCNVLGWTDDFWYLFWYTGISLLHLLKILNLDIEQKHPATRHLVSNIRYSFAATETFSTQVLVLAILSLPEVNSKVRQKACEILGIKTPKIFVRFKEAIEFVDKWLKGNIDPPYHTSRFEFLRILAEMESSIP